MSDEEEHLEAMRKNYEELEKQLARVRKEREPKMSDEDIYFSEPITHETRFFSKKIGDGTAQTFRLPNPFATRATVQVYDAYTGRQMNSHLVQVFANEKDITLIFKMVPGVDEFVVVAIGSGVANGESTA